MPFSRWPHAGPKMSQQKFTKKKRNEKRFSQGKAARAAAKETTGCDREALKSRLRASLSKYRGDSCFSAAASEVTDVSSGESLLASLMASHFQRGRERESSFQRFPLKCTHCQFRATSGLEAPTAVASLHFCKVTFRLDPSFTAGYTERRQVDVTRCAFCKQLAVAKI